ncbi:MAG: MFS transporter [Desulfovibrio sp.]|jgi:MFS family permease|nr:MFS transporter [Desulfovibrio sp.]
MHTLIRATRKLRIRALLIGLGVLLLTLGFNALLSISTFHTLASDLVLSGYRSAGERLARDVERGMRFGKPLRTYAGMADMLAELHHDTEGIHRLSVVNPEGRLLYAVPPLAEAETGSVRAPEIPVKDGETFARRQPVREIDDGYRIAVPLHRRGMVGWLIMDVGEDRVDAATEDFLGWSSMLVAGACLLVGLILAGRLGLLTGLRTIGTSLPGTLRLLLITVGLAQLAYACATLTLFYTFTQDAMRTTADILDDSIGRDFERLIHKGVDLVAMVGTSQALDAMLKANPELAGASLAEASGKVVASAGHVPEGALTVERPIHAYWPSRYRQREEVLRLKLALRPEVMRSRLSSLALNLGGSLVVSILLLLELSKMLGLIALRKLPSVAAQAPMPPIIQMLRMTSFLFFLGYDLSLSFIPLLARQMHDPSMGLNPTVSAGLPLSAEMVCTFVAVLLSGGILLRHGWRKVITTGTLGAAIGLALCSLAPNLYMLIAARAVCGISMGFTIMSLQIGALSNASAGAGTTNVFAGLFSGSICGSAIGGMLADHMSFQMVLAIEAGMIMLTLITLLPGRAPAGQQARQQVEAKRTSEAPEAKQGSFLSRYLQVLLNKNVHMMLLVSIPFAMCVSGFLHFLMPIRLASINVEKADIARMFMLYNLCFIFIGPLLGKCVDQMKDKALFYMFGGILLGATLLIASMSYNVGITAIAVITMGIGQCFFKPASMTCMLMIATSTNLTKERMAPLYKSVERIGKIVGPTVFGVGVTVIAADHALQIYGFIICIFALLFYILWRMNPPCGREDSNQSA